MPFKIPSSSHRVVRFFRRSLFAILPATRNIVNIYRVTSIDGPGLFWCEYIGPCVKSCQVDNWAKDLSGYKLVLGKLEPKEGYYVCEDPQGNLTISKPSKLLDAIHDLRIIELSFNVEEYLGDK